MRVKPYIESDPINSMNKRVLKLIPSPIFQDNKVMIIKQNPEFNTSLALSKSEKRRKLLLKHRNIDL